MMFGPNAVGEILWAYLGTKQDRIERKRERERERETEIEISRQHQLYIKTVSTRTIEIPAHDTLFHCRKVPGCKRRYHGERAHNAEIFLMPWLMPNEYKQMPDGNKVFSCRVVPRFLNLFLICSGEVVWICENLRRLTAVRSTDGPLQLETSPKLPCASLTELFPQHCKCRAIWKGDLRGRCERFVAHRITCRGLRSLERWQTWSCDVPVCSG